MKEKVTRIKVGETTKLKGRTDWDRVHALTDEDIKQAIAEDSDAAPILTAEDWRHAKLMVPQPKVSAHLRIDQDVMDWFRKQGPGHLTRMNAVLRNYFEAHKAVMSRHKKV